MTVARSRLVSRAGGAAAQPQFERCGFDPSGRPDRRERLGYIGAGGDAVIEKINDRREKLRAELEAGRKMLADLETRRSELQSTLLRISGALQVLDELVDGEERGGSERGGG